MNAMQIIVSQLHL